MKDSGWLLPFIAVLLLSAAIMSGNRAEHTGYTPSTRGGQVHAR